MQSFSLSLTCRMHVGNNPLLLVLVPFAHCHDQVLIGGRYEGGNSQVLQLDLLRQRPVVSQQVFTLCLELRLDVCRFRAALLVACVQRLELLGLMAYLLLQTTCCAWPSWRRVQHGDGWLVKAGSSLQNTCWTLYANHNQHHSSAQPSQGDHAHTKERHSHSFH